MCKKTLIVEQIIGKYFPVEAFLKEFEAQDLNIERLVEKCIARESGLTWANNGKDAQLEYDFVEDKSDAKTASCSKVERYCEKNETLYTSYRGKITSVETKLGDLRCVVYNEYRDALDFFLIPHNYIKFMSSNLGGRKVQGKKVINYSYNTTKNTYSNNMEDFRVPTFKDICKVVVN